MVPTSNTFSWDKGLQGVEEKEKKYLTNLLVRWWQIFQMVAVPVGGGRNQTSQLSCILVSLLSTALLHIYNCVPDCKPTAASLLVSNEAEDNKEG